MENFLLLPYLNVSDNGIKLINSLLEYNFGKLTKLWRIKNQTLQKRYVLSVILNSSGVKNGQKIGMKLNIVLRNVPKIQNKARYNNNTNP